MPRKIHDEFAHLPISRQRKYQLRKASQGLCTLCGEPVVYGARCLKHIVEQRERQRRKLRAKRRYNSLSYLLQQDPAAVAQRLQPARAQ